MRSKYLIIAVFFSGLTSLAVEMAVQRLMATTFGAGQEVWAAIIGLILIYLTAGYFLGGYWADRSPSYRTFFQILVWAAFWVGLVPLISRPVLRYAALAFDKLELATMLGAFLAVLIMLVVPITLLGTASPFAIRLSIEDAKDAGRTSGRIYGISTIGSFIGTFLPALVLIPNVGTYQTFLIIAGMMLVVALFCLWRTSGWKIAAVYLWMPVVLIILAVFAMRGPDKATEGQIYEGESAYNYIEVLENVMGKDVRVLRLNEGQGIHSEYHPTILRYNGPWEQVLVGPFFNPAPHPMKQVQSMAIVGLAAGTTARQATAVYGQIPIDGFEIDPKVVEVGRKYFGMTEPNLNVITADGRWGLEHSEKRYSVISVDAYRPPYIPWFMTTREFFQITRDHLTDDGVLVINVGHGPDDRRLINTIGGTIAAVYPSVYVMDIPGTFNSIIYATNQPTSADNLRANYDYLKGLGNVHPLLLDTMQTTLANMKAPPSGGEVLTDDKAPVEWITSTMILDFFLSGDVEKMQ